MGIGDGGVDDRVVFPTYIVLSPKKPESQFRWGVQVSNFSSRVQKSLNPISIGGGVGVFQLLFQFPDAILTFSKTNCQSLYELGENKSPQNNLVKITLGTVVHSETKNF